MILQELTSYYDQLVQDPEKSESIPKYGWSTEKVSFALLIDDEGRPQSLFTIGPIENGKLRPATIVVPEHSGRSGRSPKPYFLCDTAPYILGPLGDDTDSSKRERSKVLHQEVLDGCDDEAASAVLKFFEIPKPADLISSEALAGIKSSDQVVICYGGIRDYVHERKAIRDAWMRHLESQASDEDECGTCSVLGEYGPLARLFPQIKGLPGAQPSGASLVSYNFPASESYGKSQSYNASISKTAAFKAGNSLTYLLKDTKRRIMLGNTIVTYWTDRPAPPEDAFISAILSGYVSAEDEALKQSIGQAFEEIRYGKPLTVFDAEVGYCVLGVSPNMARISVRFFETGTLGQLAQDYGMYLSDTGMEGVSPLSIAQIISQITSNRDTKGRAKDESIPSTFIHEIMAAMWQGANFPMSLEYMILSRMRADHASKFSSDLGKRAALLKGCLVRRARNSGKQFNKEDRIEMSLNRENNDIGYLIGRMFAVMENAQRSAIGATNSTIRDRYYSAAMMTPQRVFSSLMRGYETHIGTLRKKKPGLAVIFDKEMGEIIEMLPGDGSLPKTLDSDEQSAFCIGFYQERQALWKTNDDDKENTQEGEE